MNFSDELQQIKNEKSSMKQRIDSCTTLGEINNLQAEVEVLNTREGELLAMIEEQDRKPVNEPLYAQPGGSGNTGVMPYLF